MMTKKPNAFIEQPYMTNTQLYEPQAPKRTRRQEFWQLFRKNKLAIMGLVLFVLFFFTALGGLVLTSGPTPFFEELGY